MTKYICRVLCNPVRPTRQFHTIKEAKDWGRAHTEKGARFEIEYQTDSTSGIIWRQTMV